MNQYIGKILDNRYEILDVIGVGGMAVVYKAYCHRLHRFVAIKVLKRDLAADAEFRRRFHEEAQAVAMLSHPNIVSVYDVSKGDDLDYIVMELIDGITLKQYMQKKQGRLNWRESLYFITQIVRALGHAHSRGIIHRDIKPQNIMVLRDGSVKVADFGIARIMSAAQTTLTQEALGSVHYISPEQARGSHIDARADIYSAGVVLYEMLTGRLPFDGDSPVSVAIQHINAKPIAPREIVPDIPLGLEQITMKAMASRIDQRYMNAEAMLRDLEEFRKNPQVDFHYDLASFHGSQPVPDEPTQSMDSSSSLNRRQHPPARTRTAPPPPRRRPPEERYDEEPETRRNWVIPVVVVVFLAAVGVFLWITFFSDMFSQEDALRVPNLLGQNISDVLQDGEVLEHFNVVEQSRQASDEYEEGEIISQDPDAGTEVTADEGPITIHVVVSSGQETMDMIDVVGDTYETAVTRLQQMDLKVDTPVREHSDDVEEGKVISSDPAEGAQVHPGDTVKLVISDGPETKMVTVPTLTGTTLESARQIAAGAGLTISNVTEVNSNYPAGQVIYQSVAPNTEVEEGTSIVLQVSLGPAQTQPDPEPTTHTKTISVTLPTDERESVAVRITVDGKEVYSQEVNTDQGTVYTSVRGSGTAEVCVYFDGELADQYSLNFDE
ncbi:Stk1 family PASTA domain-containing Ser/Thr kinase [Evtepia sp.]